MERRNTDVTAGCPHVQSVLAHIGDKWAVLVVGVLGAGSLRFNALRREIGGISQRMLTLTLRSLERDGLLTRTVHPAVPPRVEYALTPLGHSLLAAVTALGKWAFANEAEITAARKRYDGAHGIAPSAATSRPLKKVA